MKGILEKSDSSLPMHDQKPSKRNLRIKQVLIASLIILYLIRTVYVSLIDKHGYIANILGGVKQKDPHNPDSLCPLVDKLDPSEYLYSNDTLAKILHDDKFKNESRSKLLGAVRIPTEVYDNFINPNQADSLEELYKLEPLWKPFEKFHTFLEKTFPLVHKNLQLEKVNKLGLVYTWEGSDPDKKPILLTAHYDVVPVQKETLNQWTYPPFEGGFDGEFLYGRGVSDCKNLLIGLLETIELLLSENKFSPQRTIILAFGYDEESSGTGAEAIGKHLTKKYGDDSIFQIIDEGNEGFELIEGTKFILPATGEKGHLDSQIDLFTPGGHSSVPPDHTSIGIILRLISNIEDVQFDSILTNANPVLSQLQCVAEHSETVSKSLKSDILKSHFDIAANKKVLDYLSKDPKSKYLVKTSQAADMIQGGAKANALPEHVSVLVNHRVAVEENVASVGNKVLNQIKHIAERFDLGIIFEGKEILKPTANGYFNYTLVGSLEPAPVTPTNDQIWNLFGGSLRYLYEELVFPEEDDIYVFAPFLSTGNTDTKSYWNLSRNIFRYEPGIPSKDSHIHSIDERLVFEGHFHIIAFYYYYIQVLDQVIDEPIAI